jgi:tetratricopeptide (TPR) repeat protein
LIPYSLLLSSAYLAHKYTEVIEISEKALKQKPETSNVWEMIISACLSCEKPEKALEFLQVASSKWPNDDNFYRLKANAFQQQKKYKESIEITKERITRTASLSNNLSYVYTALSNYLLLDEDWDEALVSSEKAIELDPTNCNSIGNKCLALKKLGKTEDWKKILTEKIHDIPDHYTTACYYSILEDKENTLRFLKKAIEIDSAQKARSKFDPEFKIYENDKDFIELTSSKL